jgi:hypothetical protein
LYTASFHVEAQGILAGVTQFSDMATASTNNPLRTEDLAKFFNFSWGFDHEKAFGHDFEAVDAL